MNTKLPSLGKLKELLVYDPKTGTFTWKIDVARNVKAGDRAGGKTGNYRMLCVDGIGYFEHRLAWYFMTGEDPGERCVDHIDRNKLNNAFSNLRLANYSQNAANVGVRGANKVGVNGVYWNKVKERWQANISINGKRVNLGRYKKLEDAVNARLEGEKEYFGDFRVQ